MKKNNQFLINLLDLEVAGKDAISAPGNWSRKPLLDVQTEIDEIIQEISPMLISGNDSKGSGVWWFLVGSPGNGKSAAVGALVRALKDNHNAQFREPKVDGKFGRELSQLGQTEIPYQMELYEEGNNFATALFAQDASVVPNPYDNNPNSGSALVELLKAASEKGQSVVVCANRGIIEKALQEKGVNKEPWYQALKSIRDGKSPNPIEFKKTTNNKFVFEKVNIKVTTLDKKSIVSDKTFKKLISKATQDSNWVDCQTCESSSLCPFKSNRDWLKNDEGLSRFAEVVRYGELMSGQVIVFREALALLSLMLSGSSRDYSNITPCDWVHQKIEKRAIFSLLSKRIYMVLFSSYSPFGLRTEESNKIKQLSTLSESIRFLGESSRKAMEALSAEKVSTDIGLKRFFSLDGIFSELDPVRENQGKLLEQKWNLDPNNAENLAENQPLIGEIEKECFSIWADCEKTIDKMEQKGIVHEYYRELRHWITSVTYRLGFFSEGKILFQDELKEYQKVLDINEEKMSFDDEDLKINLEKSLKEFVFGTDDTKIKISEVLTVYGEKVSGKLRPKVDLKRSQKTRLIMSIDGGEPIEISPRSFVWLRRKDRTGMSNKTFPPEVHQIASDIRHKAASAIDYAFIPDDVFLVIKKPDNTYIYLERLNSRLRERDVL
jgi:hypothetical protein